MIQLLAAATALTLGQASYGWDDIVQPNFKDAKFTAHVVSGNQKELKKINDDFGQSYRFTSTTAWVKEPFMLKMEAQVEDAKVSYIINGTMKAYKLGSKATVRDNVANAPGKRQTLFDFGILTPSLFKDLFVAKFIRVDRGGELVFDCTYMTKFDDTSRYRIWVDKEKRYVTKRVWFSQEGEQRATFIYENPKLLSGVWFPTKCTVKNNDDKVAGITEYIQMSINSGLPDSIFKI
jgi:outer membrane lipoprotein-sorting protein